MRTARLDDMTRGWFVGNFVPTLYKTNDCEVGVKSYKAGSYEEKHHHKVATEITVINSGKVKMFNKIWVEGDIIVVEPGDITGFEALEKSSTTVVKIPGVLDDKYEVN